MRGGLFAGVVGFELRYYLSRVSTWLYFALLFAFGVLMISIAGGAFQNVAASTGGREHVNSPLAVALWLSVGSIFATMIVAAVVGNSVYRDYESGIHPLLFTTGLRKRDYLLGRFTGSVLVNLVILLGIPLGLLVGGAMPNLERSLFGPVRASSYLRPLLLLVLPNLLLVGAIFFALAALTRQMLSNYVGGAALVVGYSLAGSLLSDAENKTLAALLDPFGMTALEAATRYWSVAEKNARALPFDDRLLLANRALWLGAAALIFAFAYARFRFAQALPERASARRAGPEEEAEPLPAAAPTRLMLPEAPRAFSGGAHLRMWAALTRRQLVGIVRNRYFAAIVAVGIAFLVVAGRTVGKLYGTTTWPVTYQVVELMGGTFGLFILIIIAFYAGELVWRERDLRADQIHDTLPTPTWVPFLAKLAALVATVALLLGVVMLSGIVTQAARGYTRFEIPLYLKALFGVEMARYFVLCVLALTVHTLVNQKYVGHFVFILFILLVGILPRMGLEHNLLRFNQDSGMIYSDMNGYGPFTGPWLWWRAYWTSVALLLIALTALFWVRGRDQAWRARVSLARARLRPRRMRALTLASALLVLTLAGWTFYNTTVLNPYRTAKQEERDAAEYEKRYKRFEFAPQPRIVANRVWVDLYPARNAATVRGAYLLQNKTAMKIDSLHLRVPRDAGLDSLTLDRAARTVLDDPARGYRILRLARPLQPGETMALRWRIVAEPKGFPNRVTDTDVVSNGTFFNNFVFPHVGYSAERELSDARARKRHGLKPKPRMAPPEDVRARRNNYISSDADWVNFEAFITTAANQTAIAPGYLVEPPRTVNGRRTFHYRMDAPILNFYAVLSARYAVRADVWLAPPGAAPTNSVAIGVYFDAKHAYNVGDMIRAVKASLAYYTRNFGPYQHRQVRIVEFPRYAAFAQSFPNTIPYSEAIGFIARLTDPNDIDYPFYITAHEVAHQWWAHQVIGANTQGATLLSETLSQYSALMVMEKRYGKAKMKRFLAYELDRYLIGRATERQREMPLARVENQQYIHYNKGSLAMYALRDLIGEDRLNAALARFAARVRFQQPPYTTSLELLRELRTATPDSLQYAITDLFETITLWDNRAKSATATRLRDGRYRVTLMVEARKARADTLGAERDVPMNDLVDVGVFGPAPAGAKDRDSGPVLYLAKQRIRGGTNRIVVTVPTRPARAGIDPLRKLIDRRTDDNTMAVKGNGSA